MNKKLTYSAMVFIIIALASYAYFYKFSPEAVHEIITQHEVPTEVPPEDIVTITKTYNYIEIMDGCDATFSGECVNMREGPGTQYPVYKQLRTGIVLKVGEIVEVDGQTWYKIIFPTKLAYPERIKTDLYVADGDYLRLFEDVGDEYTSTISSTTTKKL